MRFQRLAFGGGPGGKAPWPSSLRGPSPYSPLINLHAPARPGGQHELTILNGRRRHNKLVAPRDAVDVNFHDPEIRHDGAEMRGDGAAQMAVKVVRRDVQFIGVGHRGDLY